MRFLALILLAVVSAGAQVSQVLPAMGSNTSPVTGATLTFVNKASNTCAATTCAVTYSPTTGNLVRVWDVVRDDTASQPNPLTTDNGTSTWASAFASTQQGTHYYLSEDYTLAAAGSPTTITCHGGAAAQSVTCIVLEYHRTSGSWVFGGASSVVLNTTQTTFLGGSVTPTASVPALIGGDFFQTSNSGNTFSTSGSYTLRGNQTDTFDGAVVGETDQIVTSTSGSYTAAAAVASSSGYGVTTWYK